MSKKAYIPNSHQMPNFIADRLMQYLTPEEVAVLLFIIRHTLGWQDKAETRSNHISLSAFENGFTTRDGKRFGGCGMSKKKVIAALRELERFGIIQRPGYTQDGTQITLVLNEDEIDWSALQARAETRAASNRKRASRTAASRAETSVHPGADTGATMAPVPPRHQCHPGTDSGATMAPIAVPPWHTYKYNQIQSNTLRALRARDADASSIIAVAMQSAGDDRMLATMVELHEPSAVDVTEPAQGAPAPAADAEAGDVRDGRGAGGSDSPKMGAETLALFRHMQRVLVERVWNGNRRMFGAAGDMALMMLGINHKPQYAKYNFAKPPRRDEFDDWVEWWSAKRLSFPRSPAAVEQSWIDYRAARDVRAHMVDREGSGELSDYHRLMLSALEVIRSSNESEGRTES